MQRLGASLVKFKSVLAGAVERILRDKLAEAVSVKDFGAKGDGVTNDTVAIQRAIDSGCKVLSYPEGVYMVDPGTLLLASDQRHVGLKATVKLRSDLEGQAIFTGISKNLITFSGFRFEAAGTKAIAPAVNAVSCDYMTMRECVSVYIALFSTKSRKCPQPMVAHDIGFGANSAYPLIVDEADYCHDIKVLDCTSVGDNGGILGGEFRPAAIYTSFSKGVHIEGNNIDGHKEGIQFVGGDALKEDEGYDINAPRKCYNVTIIGNVVKNSVGGIWGSMGHRVTITGNNVEKCRDVAIDFESCTESVAVGNTTVDAANGCLTAIGVCKDVVFEANTCTLTAPGEYVSIGGVYYEDNQDALTSVSFVNNKFTSYNKQAILHIKSCASVKMDNNQFENVQVTTTTNTTVTRGLRWFTFCNNQMLFTAATPGAYTALAVGNIRDVGNVNINNNQIVHASSSQGQYGIRLADTNGGGRAMVTVSGNVAYGYSEDINVSYGSTSTVNLSGNIFQTKGGSGQAKVVATGNCDTNGNPWSWS